MFKRTIFCFFILVLAVGPARSQTIVCNSNGFMFNHFMRVTAPSGVNLRAAPSQQAAKLVAIPYGAEIPVAANYSDEQLPEETIEGKYARWNKAAYAGKTGYVFSGFLEELHDKTAVRFLIPDAGVDFQRDELDLDPAVTWFALAPNEKVNSTYQSDYRQMVASRVKLGEVTIPGQDVARHPPLNAPENTTVFFAGIQPGTRGDYYQPEEPEMLFPGAVITFHLYDEALKQQRIYQVYATGQPIAAPKDRGYWPFTGIQNYQLRVREVSYSPVRVQDAYRVVSDQLLFSGNLTFDMETGRINGLSLFLMGDFDNDRKLDILLDWHGDKGSVYYLFLSSKALPGFMMRVVAMMSASCC
jgi:hypothetical protein